MEIGIRPKAGVTVIGEQCKGSMLWHLYGVDDIGNSITIILSNKQMLDLKKQLNQRKI